MPGAQLVELLADAERSQIRTLAEAAAGLDVARLDIGQPDLPVPRSVVEATARAASTGLTGYTATAGVPELRARIAVRLQGLGAGPALAAETFVTTGGTNAMALALAATVEPGATVLVPELHWPNLRAMARMLRAPLATYPLDPATLAPDPEALLAVARRLRPAAVVLNSPGNPTGAVLAPASVELVVAGLRDLGCWLISDEVYDDLAYDGAHAPARRFGREHVISVHSFSKSYSMTGYRLGYVWADAPVVAALTRIQEGCVTCSSSVAQHAGIAALDLGGELLEARRHEYRRRRDLVDRLLREADLGWVRPAGAFYGLVRVRPGASPDGLGHATRLLRDFGVAVAPGSAFGASPVGTVRLSLAAADDVLRRGIDALARADTELG